MKKDNSRDGSQKWRQLKSFCHVPIYNIYSQEDLAGMKKGLGIKGKHIIFRLMNDIRLKPGMVGMDPVKGWEPIGNDSSEESNFLGTFDGRGHTISGLWIQDPEQAYAGLWGAIGKGAVVKDVCISTDKKIGIKGKTIGGITGLSREATISGCKVYGSSPFKGDESIGGLVGYLIGGKIENSTAEISLEGNKNGCLVGGLVGYQYLSNICDSDAQSYVQSKARRAHIGGIVGMQYYSSISNCKVKGEVYAQGSDSCVGGIVGEQCYANIIKSSANVIVRSKKECNYYGRLVGLQFEGAVKDSFSAGKLEIEEAETCSIGYHLYNYRKQLSRHKFALHNPNLPDK